MIDYTLYCTLMHVILDIFSGMPNPNWDLSEQQRDEFLNKVSILPITNKSSQNDIGLGYRGFIVEDKLKQFEINDGLVKVSQNNTVDILEDKEYNMEIWLLDTAPNNVDPSLLKMVKESIEERKKNNSR